MSDTNKNFTGFKFVDEKLGGLLPNKLCCVGGDFDPIIAEQFCLTLLKNIADNNQNKVVVLVNFEEFIILNCNITDFIEGKDLRSKTIYELSRRLPMRQVIFIQDVKAGESLKNTVLCRVKKQNIAAVFIADSNKDDANLKILATELQVPVIAYDRGYIAEEEEQLINRHLNADIVIHLKVAEDNKSSKLTCYKKDFDGVYIGQTNQKGSLQEYMDWELPDDKDKFWFYE